MPSEEMESAGEARRWVRARVLVHPAFTGAVAILAVNDQFLKGRFPGSVTGKLSDFAGVFAMTVVLGAITGNRASAALAGFLGFAALKMSPTV